MFKREKEIEICIFCGEVILVPHSKYGFVCTKCVTEKAGG